MTDDGYFYYLSGDEIFFNIIGEDGRGQGSYAKYSLTSKGLMMRRVSISTTILPKTISLCSW